jgi:glutamate--cysteine ligase
MDWDFKGVLQLFSRSLHYKLLTRSGHGIEKESLRSTPKAKLSSKAHPRAIGNKSTHPYISTDFSEAQLEFITPPLPSLRGAHNFLKELHLFTYSHLNNEIIWPHSMPCILPEKDFDIPVAYFGPSEKGKLKSLYRVGLGYRYGRKLQTISGIHYNYSLDKSVFRMMRDKFSPEKDLQEFINDAYMGLVRNFLRYAYINTYLFGASPACDRSYLDNIPKGLEEFDQDSLYAPKGCSIRMSNLGYYSKVQAQLAVSYNSLDKYINDLHYAVSTPHPDYKKIGLKKNGQPIQINSHILQMESEHYTRIRPKGNIKLSQNSSPLEALSQGGVEYIEARALDLDPYSPYGISLEQLQFLQCFMLYCLFKDSPPILAPERKKLVRYQNKIAVSGRESLEKEEAVKILEEMKKVAQLLDKNYHSRPFEKSLEKQIEKIYNPSQTPSARILREMQNHDESFIGWGLRLAERHSQFYQKQLKQEADEGIWPLIAEKKRKTKTTAST